MTTERQLHCYTNGTDTVSAYSVEDALNWLFSEGGYDRNDDDIDDPVQVPDDTVLTIAQEDAPLFSECECATWARMEMHRLSINGHHSSCEIANPSKTAREWASQGRGLVCSTEW